MRLRQQLLFSLFLTFTIFIIAFCDSANAKEIVDMAGRKVIVPDVLTKIYSASPPATAMIYAIDPELIAALNYPSREDEEKFMLPLMKKLPVAGGWFGQGQTLNLETLVQVKPDIVLVWQWKKTAANEKIENTLKPLGFPVVYIKMDTLYDYPAVFEFLGKLLNREKRVGELVEYAEKSLNDLDDIQGKISDKERLGIYYAEGVDGLSTECSSSVHAELIPLCRGRNVHICEEKNGFGMEKISMEQVIRYNPDVILARESAFCKTVYTDPRWKNIKAVKAKKVFQIPRSPFDWFDRPPSFMRLLGARWLMNKLYPQQYNVDMVKETIIFYQLFLNVPLDQQTAEEILFYQK